MTTTVIPRLRVQTCATWPALDAGWTTQDRLSLGPVVEGLSQEVGSLTLTLEHGYGTTPDDPVPQDLPELDLAGKWVRLLRPDPAGSVVLASVNHRPCWWGLVRADTLTPDHDATAYGGRTAYQVAGLGYALDQVVLDRGWELSAAGAVVDPGEPLVFNDDRADRSAGTHSVGGRLVHTHDRAAGTASWTARQAADFLLAAATEAMGGGLRWELAGDLTLLDFRERWDLRGLTVFQSLCRLVSPRRGAGFRISAAGQVATLTVRSILPAAVTVDGWTIPAASTITDVDLRGAADLRASLGTNWDQRVDRLVARAVRGALVGLTLAYRQDQTLDLVRGWTGAEETTWAGLSAEQRAQPQYAHIWRRFLLRSDWTGRPALTATSSEGLRHYQAQVSLASPLADQALYGIGGETGSRFHLDPATTLPAPLPHAQTLRLERLLPMRAGLDYSGALPPEDVTRPQLGIRVYVGRAGTGWWDQTEGGSAALDAEPIQASPLAEAAGIQLEGGPEVAERVRAWLTRSVPYDLAFTVGVHEPRPLRVVWVRDPADQLRDQRQVRELVVQGAEEWRVLEGTILRAQGGAVVQRASTLTVKEGVPRLREVLGLARRWYANPERDLPLELQGLDFSDDYAPGAVIGTLILGGAVVPVDEAIVSRTWDPVAGTTTIQTERILPDLDPVTE